MKKSSTIRQYFFSLFQIVVWCKVPNTFWWPWYNANACKSFRLKRSVWKKKKLLQKSLATINNLAKWQIEKPVRGDGMKAMTIVSVCVRFQCECATNYVWIRQIRFGSISWGEKSNQAACNASTYSWTKAEGTHTHVKWVHLTSSFFKTDIKCQRSHNNKQTASSISKSGFSYTQKSMATKICTHSADSSQLRIERKKQQQIIRRTHGICML